MYQGLFFSEWNICRTEVAFSPSPSACVAVSHYIVVSYNLLCHSSKGSLHMISHKIVSPKIYLQLKISDFYKYNSRFLSQVTSNVAPTMKERVASEYTTLWRCLQHTFCFFCLPVISSCVLVYIWSQRSTIILCLPAFKITYNWCLGHIYHQYRVNCWRKLSACVSKTILY